MSQKTPLVTWQGKAAIGDGWGTFTGASGDNVSHKHLAIQIVIANGGNVQLHIADNGLITAPAFVIAPAIVHQLMPGAVSLLYVEPDSPIGRALMQRCVDGYWLPDETMGNAMAAALHQQDGRECIKNIGALLGVLTESSDKRVPRDRVEHLIANLARREQLPKTLTQFAREASLSPSHLRHRMVSIVGMPFRSYLRWLRLQRALAFAAAGASLTEAALAADFADAAHLTRTMRRHFGITPRDVIKALR